MNIPLSRPDIGEAEEQAVLEVLRSGIVAMGPKTQAFEEAWAAYCGVKHAVMMANGTVAQEAVLRALDIGAGDEVITVSFTFNATASAILQVGAKPVFVDIREEDFGIDPDQVEAAITPRTQAIMPVHLYGLMPDMDPLVEIAKKSRADDHRGRGPGSRCPVSRQAGGPVRARDVQPLRHQEPDDGRGRLRDDRRRPPGRPAAPLPQPRHAPPLLPRVARHEFQADRHRCGPGDGPAAATGRADRATPPERRAAHRRHSMAT